MAEAGAAGADATGPAGAPTPAGRATPEGAADVATLAGEVGPDAGEPAAPGLADWLAREARRFPACVLPNPGKGGADGLGAAACVMLAPPGSNRAAHFGLVDGEGWAAATAVGALARPGWGRRSA